MTLTLGPYDNLAKIDKSCKAQDNTDVMRLIYCKADNLHL